MTTRRTIPRLRAAIAGGMALAIAMVALPGSTLAADRDREGSCRAGSEWYLDVSRESGQRLEVDFEVESDRRGEAWRVRLKNDGKVFFRGTRTTNRAGEFDVERYTRDGRGKDRIVARAKSLSTGEVCRAVIRI